MLTLVAPFTGAWIEIVALRHCQLVVSSLPSRERGLKSEVGPENDDLPQSLPSRERGLKS